MASEEIFETVLDDTPGLDSDVRVEYATIVLMVVCATALAAMLIKSAKTMPIIGAALGALVVMAPIVYNLDTEAQADKLALSAVAVVVTCAAMYSVGVTTPCPPMPEPVDEIPPAPLELATEKDLAPKPEAVVETASRGLPAEKEVVETVSAFAF